MAKSAEVSMNVSAIRLVDRLVCDIVDTATHVVLYEFNAPIYEWEKTNAEGALFIYHRNGDPRYNIIVLNRLNTNNLVEPVDEGIDIQLQEPFLLYRNSSGEIHGIWFYDREDCVRIAKTIDRLVREVSNSKNTMETRLKSSDLHKSHQPETPDGTSKRVMDFFARAGSKAPSQPPGPRAPPPGLPIMPRDPQLSEVNPLLQRLMSNPNPITVEQLEKQHRSSPQDTSKIRGKSIMKKETVARRPLTLPVHSSPQIENGMNLLHLGESEAQGYTPSSISTQHFFNSGISHSPSEPLEVSVLEQSVTMETPSKPALIPPVMFASAKEETTPLVVKPEPLTKSQLLQAVTYLLKNDADFINKLHEAYVKSFVDMVS